MIKNLQRGVVNVERTPVQCICEVSDPKNVAVLLTLHGELNNDISAQGIFELVSNAYGLEDVKVTEKNK